MPKRPGRRRSPKAKWGRILLYSAAAALACFLVLRYLFVISYIEVRGNRICSTEDVIVSSGIKIGDSVFTLRNDRIRANINGNRYLEFVSVWRKFTPPCTITLTVREHVPYAKLTWMGLLRVIGDHGIVLERTAQVDLPIPVPELVGMVVSQAEVGREVVYTVPGQADAINSILEALYTAGLADLVAQVHVSIPDSLHLMTRSGMQIMLGDSGRMQEKIDLVHDTLPHIALMGDLNGTLLDVSTAEAADFRASIFATPAPYAYADPTPTAPPETESAP